VALVDAAVAGAEGVQRRVGRVVWVEGVWRRVLRVAACRPLACVPVPSMVLSS